jgi:DNA-directed RNA polymerase specialized sigma24 family protein
MARGCVPHHLRGKFDPEDVVQATLMKLHQANGARGPGARRADRV